MLLRNLQVNKEIKKSFSDKIFQRESIHFLKRNFKIISKNMHR